MVNLDNSKKTFEEMKISSKDKCLWRCSICGYEWPTQFKSRAGQNRSCPNCSNIKRGEKVTFRAIEKVGTLAEKCPELLKEWDYNKNHIDPYKIPVSSEEKVNWICERCGYSWKAQVVSRTKKGTGCRKCAGKVVELDNSMAQLVPEILEYVDYDYNDKPPTAYRPNSHIDIHLKCPKCGHKWVSKPYVFYKEHRCPACFGYVASSNNNLKTKFPETAKLFLEHKNGIKATEITPHSNKKYYFSCGVCGSPTKKSVDKAVTRGVLCRECSARYHTSFPEQALLYYAKKYFGENVVNRYLMNNRKDGESDIYLSELKIGIEYDSFYHHSKKDKSIIDKRKDEIARNNGINLIRLKEGYTTCMNSNIITVKKNASDEDLSTAINLVFLMINPLKEYDIDIHKDKIEILNRFYTSPVQNNIKELYPNVVNDWDYEKNINLKPEFFTKGSNKSVYWKNTDGTSTLRRIASQVKKYERNSNNSF